MPPTRPRCDRAPSPARGEGGRQRYAVGMYTVDGRDKVIRYDGLPPWDTGAPLPTVLCDEGTVLVAYVVNEPNLAFDGTNPRGLSAESQGELIAIIRFSRVRSVMFGSPNDEVLHGHPLYGRGLEFYGAHEVLESSWIRAMERIASAHHAYTPGRATTSRHFILAFHDSTFECIAKSVEVIEIIRGSVVEVRKLMVGLLQEG